MQTDETKNESKPLPLGAVSTRYYCVLNVAENNDYGASSGKASMIGFGSMADFEPDNFKGYAFRLSQYTGGGQRIHLSGKMYPIKKVIYHAGNIIWNSYLIDTTSATGIFNQLVKPGKWAMTSGDVELDVICEAKGILQESDFIRIYKSWHP